MIVALHPVSLLESPQYYAGSRETLTGTSVNHKTGDRIFVWTQCSSFVKQASFSNISIFEPYELKTYIFKMIAIIRMEEMFRECFAITLLQ